MEYTKSLAGAGTGAINKLTGPLDVLIDPGGTATQQITIAYYDDGSLDRLQEKINEAAGLLLAYTGDKSTGKISSVVSDGGGGETTTADCAYDSYGRLIEATDHSTSTTRHDQPLADRQDTRGRGRAATSWLGTSPTPRRSVMPRLARRRLGRSALASGGMSADPWEG